MKLCYLLLCSHKKQKSKGWSVPWGFTGVVCQRNVSERPIILIHLGLHGPIFLFFFQFGFFFSFYLAESIISVWAFQRLSLSFFSLCSLSLFMSFGPASAHTCCWIIHIVTATCPTWLAAQVTWLSWEWVTIATTGPKHDTAGPGMETFTGQTLSPSNLKWKGAIKCTHTHTRIAHSWSHINLNSKSVYF